MKALCSLLLLLAALTARAQTPRRPVGATVDTAMSAQPISFNLYGQNPEISSASVDSMRDSLTLPRFSVSLHELPAR